MPELKICKTRKLQDLKFDWGINSDCSTGGASQTLLNKDDLKLEKGCVVTILGVSHIVPGQSYEQPGIAPDNLQRSLPT